MSGREAGGRDAGSGGMRCWTGIDLGSTTTKAVILDGNDRVLGRGITNSRSNYDVACQVALDEARSNARFELFGRELERRGVAGRRREALLAELSESFRLEQYLAQLALLRAALQPDAQAVAIADRMAADAPALYAGGGSRKSDFFRDLAGAAYLRLAEEVARSGKGRHDVLVGAFDRAILVVENTPSGEGFEVHARAALARVPGAPAEAGEALAAVLEVELESVAQVGTGYGRARLPFPKQQIRSEILCHGLGAHAMFPHTRTVLDIGGQDTKAIQVDPAGLVTSFQMNDRCAAGCGRYLGYIADEMNLGLQELGPLAETAERPVRINSTCTVFAGTEVRERLSLGEKREDILAGLHRAIILRAMSLLARSGGVHDEFTFTGGVARNPAAVRALGDLVRENYGDRTLNISPDSIYTGALGAALFARRGAEAPQPALMGVSP